MSSAEEIELDDHRRSFERNRLHLMSLRRALLSPGLRSGSTNSHEDSCGERGPRQLNTTRHVSFLHFLSPVQPRQRPARARHRASFRDRARLHPFDQRAPLRALLARHWTAHLRRILCARIAARHDVIVGRAGGARRRVLAKLPTRSPARMRRCPTDMPSSARHDAQGLLFKIDIELAGTAAAV
jgi:hypothetical protein